MKAKICYVEWDYLQFSENRSVSTFGSDETNKLCRLSPRANYTDRAAAAGRRS
jgi:hypothetical protein